MSKDLQLHNDLLRQMKIYGWMHNVEPFQFFSVEIGIGGNHPAASLRNKFSDDNKKLTDDQVHSIVRILVKKEPTNRNLTEQELKECILNVFGLVGDMHNEAKEKLNGDEIVDSMEAKAINKYIVKVMAALNEMYINNEQIIADW